MFKHTWISIVYHTSRHIECIAGLQDGKLIHVQNYISKRKKNKQYTNINI